jgi:hypothetical protein
VAFELVHPNKHDILLKFVKTKITGDARSKLIVRDLTHTWTLVKMADSKCSSETSSDSRLKLIGNKDELGCVKCQDSEYQLQKVLEELSSVKMIIDILQKELLLYKPTTTTCPEVRLSTKEPHVMSADPRTPPAPNSSIHALQNSGLPTCAGIAATRPFTQSVNRRIPPNVNGAIPKHHVSQKNIQKAHTQIPNKLKIPLAKGNKISTIVNGTTDYYNEFPSIPSNNEGTAKVKLHHKKKLCAQPVKSFIKAKSRVLIIGVSHARNCATRLQDILGSEFKVSSFVKPAAQMCEISKTARNEMQSMTSEDFVIVWGGSNDIRGKVIK